jgi:diguanylate cyclase (GGDEF)-like protein
LSDKLTELGIAPFEVTPSVSIAVNSLLRKIDDLNDELAAQKSTLENLQSLIDVDADLVLPNKKAFLNRINWSVGMHKRYAYLASVVILKIDDFDEIAATYGSRAASVLSNKIASFVPNNIRDTDFFAKISEHEFGLIMYFAEKENIIKKCESVIADLRMNPVKWNNSTINFNLSFGVHQITESDTSANAFNMAHNLVYVAREQKKFEEINFKA